MRRLVFSMTCSFQRGRQLHLAKNIEEHRTTYACSSLPAVSLNLIDNVYTEGMCVSLLCCLLEFVPPFFFLYPFFFHILFSFIQFTKLLLSTTCVCVGRYYADTKRTIFSVEEPASLIYGSYMYTLNKLYM